jgi:RHS repeat-associated protein
VIYGYDANGRLNLAVADAGTAGTDTYAYTSGTNRLTSLTTAAGTRTVAYDGRGNTSGETRPGGVAVTTGYDGYARLTSYVRSGGQSLAFDYNGLDDRVTMVLGSDTRRFVYDAGGRVLGEYGSDASDVKAEFIWLSPEVGQSGTFGGGDGQPAPAEAGGYMPLAVATPDLLGAIQVNWVHGNHLGVPLVTTDSGGALATTPNDYLAPGFPGQSKVLADLFYNRYRDYDPVTGRYVQADPIGLGGGTNSYGYVGGNPLNRFDPDGLCETTLEGRLKDVHVTRCWHPPMKPPHHHDEDCEHNKPSWPVQWTPADCAKHLVCRAPGYEPPRKPRDWCGSGWTSRLVPERPGGRNVSGACRTHDQCYGSGSSTNRSTCDIRFYFDVRRDCLRDGGSVVQCDQIANLYFVGVRYGGYGAYKGKGVNDRVSIWGIFR